MYFSFTNLIDHFSINVTLYFRSTLVNKKEFVIGSDVCLTIVS